MLRATVLILCCLRQDSSCFFFFNDTATTEIYTLSLHDALPISPAPRAAGWWRRRRCPPAGRRPWAPSRDRKSTRLNSSHSQISYAVFCLKKKKRHFRTLLRTPKKLVAAHYDRDLRVRYVVHHVS